jgi:hypothetical protein
MKGIFFYAFQRYVALCILVALLRGYWQQNLTENGFVLFKVWLALCAVISISGYAYLLIARIERPKIGLRQYLIIVMFVIPTVLIFEYFKI